MTKFTHSLTKRHHKVAPQLHLLVAVSTPLSYDICTLQTTPKGRGKGWLRRVEDFKNIRTIGTGGFADVWHCERSSDSSQFAKKVLFASASNKAKQRFREEVRILAKLDHPNIVRIVATQLTDDPLWFVMPLYSHSLLDQLNGVIGDEVRIRKLFTQVINAVDYAHREGVIHRDLKPHNILMNSDDDIAVSDFGIGRVLDAIGDRVTRTGASMGTRFYMSPEQSTDAKHVDLRTDIYSLGRMLYELYTEKLNSAVQQLDRVPSHIAPIIAKCTKNRPEERYSSVAELKEDWRSVLRTNDSPEIERETTRLIAEINATPQSTAKVVSLLTLIKSDDTDLLAEVLLSIPYVSIAETYQSNPALIVEALDKFVNYLRSQTWGASYVDKSGVRCANLLSAFSDSYLRIQLLICVLELGISHRRPIVIEAASHILQSIDNRADLDELKRRVNTISQKVLQQTPALIELNECDPEVARIFHLALQRS